MIRIVCPHCHASLASAELEQASVDGCLSLVCPECSSVLVSDREQKYQTLPAHFPEEAFTHARGASPAGRAIWGPPRITISVFLDSKKDRNMPKFVK